MDVDTQLLDRITELLQKERQQSHIERVELSDVLRELLAAHGDTCRRCERARTVLATEHELC